MDSKKLLKFPIFGVLFIILSLVAILSFKYLLLKVLYSILILQSDSLLFKYYKEVPVSATNNYYFYNVSNADEIMKNGAKPKLEQIGPFVYSLYFNKTNVVFNPNDTITFYENKTWFFQRDLSISNDDVKITTLNAPLVCALTIVQIVPDPFRFLATRLIEKITDGIFIEKTVRELMFDGYPDEFVGLGPLIDPMFFRWKGRFGYLWPRNASSFVLFNVFNGKDKSKLNLNDRLDGMSHLKYWLSEECNQIEGTYNGELRPPLYLYPKKQINFLYPIIPRKLTFNYTRPVITKQGFTADQYIFDMNMFQNSSVYPSNACYRGKIPKRKTDVQRGVLSSVFDTINNMQNGKLPETSDPIEFPSGVIDLSRAFFGAPILLSKPHFLHADSHYLRTIDGLKPNEVSHDSYLNIEPFTGASIDGMFRVQVNLYINKPSGLKRYKNAPEIAFPVLWTEVYPEWPKNLATEVKWALKMITLLPISSFSLFLAIGLLLFTVFVVTHFTSKRTMRFEVFSNSKRPKDDETRIDTNRNEIGICNEAADASTTN